MTNLAKIIKDGELLYIFYATTSQAPGMMQLRAPAAFSNHKVFKKVLHYILGGSGFSKILRLRHPQCFNLQRML
jgi:hypothetical protein